MKDCYRKSCHYLKPKLASTILTIIVLAIPFIQNKSSMPDGTFFISRYSPLMLALAYIKFGKLYSLLLVLFLAFFTYLVISLLVLFVVKVGGCPRMTKK